MDQATAPGPHPPEPGQHKEEPEQAMEEDIPSDDGEATREHDPSAAAPAPAPDGGNRRVPRQIERE